MSEIITDIGIANQYLRGELDCWKPDRAHAAAYAARNPTPSFALACPTAMDREPLKDVFLPRLLVRACREKYGSSWMFYPQYQKRGTCVGQSHKVLVDILAAVNRYVTGAKFLGRAAVAAIYGMSRVEIGRNAGTWDGSNGSWAAEALEKGAYLLLEEMGLDPNPEGKQNYWKVCDQDEAKAVAWAASGGGVPENYEKMANIRPVTGASQVSTIEEVRASLSDLKPINLCGQVHPAQNRNENGCSVSIDRGGGHSTFLVGQYYDARSGMWFYDHMQSWGDFYRGKYARQDSSFKEDLMFATCITRVPESWVMKWLPSRDCYSIHGLTGVEAVDDAFRILSC